MKELSYLETVTQAEMDRTTAGMAEVVVEDGRMEPLIYKGDRVVYDKNFKEIYDTDTIIVAELNGEVIVRFATQDSEGVIRLRALSGEPIEVEVSPEDSFTIIGRGMYVHEVVTDKDGVLMMIKAKQLPMPDIPYDPLLAYDPLYDDADARWNVSKMDSDDPEELYADDPLATLFMEFAKARDEDRELRAITAEDRTMEPHISRGDRVIYDPAKTELSSEYAKPFVVEINGRTMLREAWIDDKGSVILRPYSITARAIVVEPGDDFKALGEIVSVAGVKMGPPKTEGSQGTIKVIAKSVRKPRRLR